MNHPDSFCKQPLGITGQPECDVVGPLSLVSEGTGNILPVFDDPLGFEALLTTWRKLLGGKEAVSLWRSVVHYYIAEPFEGRVGQ